MSTPRQRYVWVVQRTDPSGLTAIQAVFRSERKADDFCHSRNEADRALTANQTAPARTYWVWYKHQLQAE